MRACESRLLLSRWTAAWWPMKITVSDTGQIPSGLLHLLRALLPVTPRHWCDTGSVWGQHGHRRRSSSGPGGCRSNTFHLSQGGSQGNRNPQESNALGRFSCTTKRDWTSQESAPAAHRTMLSHSSTLLNALTTLFRTGLSSTPPHVL